MEGKEGSFNPWDVVKWLLVFAVSVLVFVGMGMGVVAGVVVAAFILVLVLGLDPVYPLALSLLALLLCPLMMALNQDGAANAFARAAWVFLATGVALLFMKNMKKLPQGDEEHPED